MNTPNRTSTLVAGLMPLLLALGLVVDARPTYAQEATSSEADVVARKRLEMLMEIIRDITDGSTHEPSNSTAGSGAASTQAKLSAYGRALSEAQGVTRKEHEMLMEIIRDITDGSTHEPSNSTAGSGAASTQATDVRGDYSKKAVPEPAITGADCGPMLRQSRDAAFKAWQDRVYSPWN